MLSGRPDDAMEAAKRIVTRKAQIDPALLAEIASNRTYKKWSRIAAIYALGFADYKRFGQTPLRVLSNRSEDSALRDHAAEALGNMREPRATATLGKVLMAKENPRIKRSCIYALSEIGTARAYSILKKFEATNPSGKIGTVLKQELTKLHSQ